MLECAWLWFTRIKANTTKPLKSTNLFSRNQDRLCGHTHLSVAHSYNNLAMVYRAQDKYEEALEMLSKSLEIKTRVYASDNHLSVADD